MKQTYKLALVLAAGVAIGVASGNAIRAQQVKIAPGYVVVELEVNDPTTFQKCGAAIPHTLAPFNGKYLVRGGKFTPIEGDAPKGRAYHEASLLLLNGPRRRLDSFSTG